MVGMVDVQQHICIGHPFQCRALAVYFLPHSLLNDRFLQVPCRSSQPRPPALPIGNSQSLNGMIGPSKWLHKGNFSLTRQTSSITRPNLPHPFDQYHSWYASSMIEGILPIAVDVVVEMAKFVLKDFLRPKKQYV